MYCIPMILTASARAIEAHDFLFACQFTPRKEGDVRKGQGGRVVCASIDSYKGIEADSMGRVDGYTLL